MGNCNADQANCKPQQCLGRMLRNAGERSGEEKRDSVYDPTIILLQLRFYFCSRRAVGVLKSRKIEGGEDYLREGETHRSQVTGVELQLLLDLRKIFDQRGNHDAKVTKDKDGSYKVYDLKMQRVR